MPALGVVPRVRLRTECNSELAAGRFERHCVPGNRVGVTPLEIDLLQMRERMVVRKDKELTEERGSAEAPS